MKLKIGIIGITGKMGKMLSSLAISNQDVEIVGGFGRGEKEAFLALANKADLLIDLSSPANLENTLSATIQFKKPLVIGTTGLSEKEKEKILLASKIVPILYSPNFSLGMAICKFLVQETAKRFKEVESVDIVEKHHLQKKDAPSGSAKGLAQVLEKEGKKVVMHSLRAGKIVGEHTAYFVSDDERIVIEHAVQNREAFAKGALLAAKFLSKQKEACLYTFEELLQDEKN